MVLVIAMPHSRVMPGVMANSDIEMGYPLIFRMVAGMLPLANGQQQDRRRCRIFIFIPPRLRPG